AARVSNGSSATSERSAIDRALITASMSGICAEGPGRRRSRESGPRRASDDAAVLMATLPGWVVRPQARQAETVRNRAFGRRRAAPEARRQSVSLNPDAKAEPFDRLCLRIDICDRTTINPRH